MEQMTGVEAAFSTVLHALLRRGQGTPPYSGLSLLAKRAAGHRAKRWPSPLLSVFFTSFLHSIFFDFSRLFTLVGVCLIPTFCMFFERDTPMDLVI